MFNRFWPPSTSQQQHGDQSAAQQPEIADQPAVAAGKRSPLAVIARPVRLLGRGVGATVRGTSNVVQSPVRAARGMRRDSTAAEAPAEPEPAPELPRKRAPWDG